MDLFAILHWLTDEVSKLSGRATASEVHAAIVDLERGGKPKAVTQPPEAEAPPVEQGTAEPTTAEVLAEVLAAIRGQNTAAPAPAEQPAPEPTEGTAPVVDPGTAPEG